MVAPTRTSSPSTPRTPSPIVQRLGIGPVRFTVDDATQMIERGIIPEDSTVELLDGELIHRDRFDLQGDQIVEGVRDNYLVGALSDLQPGVNGARRHLRSQSTLVCSETHAPIPDAMVLRGTRADYRERLPTAADAYCVIEVADSSYERDSGEKLAGYARAGIVQSIIINLRNRTAEVYVDPDPATGTYPPARIVTVSESLDVRVGDGEFYSVSLSDLLP